MKRTLRFFIDWFAIIVGGVVTYSATESLIGMIAGMIAVAAYGFWNYNDGLSA